MSAPRDFINTPAAGHHDAPDCAAYQWGCGCEPGKCRSIAYDHLLHTPKRTMLPELLLIALFWLCAAWIVL